MKTVVSAAELREALSARGSEVLGLVPTMGAFHDGHASLMRRARAECDTVVVSLFVNPLQFSKDEDLANYPRDRSRDIRIAGDAGVDVLFLPTVDEIYPTGFATSIHVSGLTEVLCGAHRGPRHFDGVATVVAKLLNIVRPQIAYFGQKDAQQLLVVRRLARDLSIPTRIEACPTVRESDGLAMSSRNAYLDAGARNRAVGINRALDAAEALWRSGEARAAPLLAAAREVLRQYDIEPEYLEIRSSTDLRALDSVAEDEGILAVAATVGRARLIDNRMLPIR